MRHVAILIGLLVATGVGCKRATDPAAPAALVLTRAFDYQGHVSQVTRACGAHPSTPPATAYVCQENVWFTTPPGTVPNAGVVLTDSTPVFAGAQGSFSRSTASAITVGDVIQIWTDGSIAYNAVEAPPGAPCYTARQIVIAR
jgi:hypothetical protein